jgi:transposase
MYVRVVQSKQKHKTYRSLQIVDSYRDPGKSPHPITKVVAHIGQVDALSDRDVDNLITGICKAMGRPTARDIDVQSFRDFGHVFAIGEIWKRLGMERILKREAERSGQSFDLETHVRLMVTNRLCDPCSKRGLLQWLEGVYFPGLAEVDYHHLLRAMDWLIEHKETIEKQIANRLVTLFTQELDLVFYDITSSYFEGERSIGEEDLRRYGYSRDQRSDRRQILIGLVMTRDGIPLCHHVFDGATADKSTVQEVVRDLKNRLCLSRVVFVGDRGMLSEANLEFLVESGFGYLVAHRLRRNNLIKAFVRQGHSDLSHDPQAGEQFRVDRRDGVQFVMAYDPQMAAELREERQGKIERANTFIRDVQQRLKKKGRGRPLTAEGALLQVSEYLQSHSLSRYDHLELSSKEELRVTAASEARSWENLIDGKLIVETTLLDASPEEIIGRYQELGGIERAFRSLKSTLKLRPVYHWTERRIRAHVFLCVLALQIERYLHSHLHEMKVSAATAIDKLRQIKAGRLVVNAVSTPMLTAAGEEHKALYKQLSLPFPTLARIEGL